MFDSSCFVWFMFYLCDLYLFTHTGVQRRCHVWNRICWSFRSTPVRPRILVGFVCVDGSLLFCIALCRLLFSLLWWTVNSIPLCSLLDLKWQAFGLWWTVGVDIRTPVALHTLMAILVVGKKRSRPDVSDPDVTFFSRSETFWSTGSWPILSCTSSPNTLC